MANSQMNEFLGRVERVERMHRRGLGFEAPGTLGRSAYREQTRRTSLTRPLFVFLAVGLILKAALLIQIGESDYKTKVDRLRAGDSLERIGAYVMQADPMTVWIAQKAKEVFAVPG